MVEIFRVFGGDVVFKGFKGIALVTIECFNFKQSISIAKIIFFGNGGSFLLKDFKGRFDNN